VHGAGARALRYLKKDGCHEARSRTRTDDPLLTMEVLYRLSYPGARRPTLATVRWHDSAAMDSPDSLRNLARTMLLSGIVLLVAGLVVGVAVSPVGYAVAAVGLADLVIAAVLSRRSERAGA
jgi:Flp pilus assembly protein TadB